MDRMISRLMAPLARRVASMLARGEVSAVDASGKQQRVQLRLLAGEIKDSVEHFEPFGFTSHPMVGAEHLTVFLDGDRSHGITVVVNDRRFRIQGLPSGAACLYDASGNYLAFNNDGTATMNVSKLTVSGDVKVDGNIVAGGNVSDQGGAKSMAGMRGVFNSHAGHFWSSNVAPNTPM